MPMLLKLSLSIFVVVSLFGFFGCSTGSNDPSLTLPDTFPKTLTVGDTTAAISAIRKARDLQGRMTTNSSYTNYYLVSDDTTIVRVTLDRLLVGMNIGTTTFTANDKDQSSGLISGKYTIMVAPR